MFDQIKKIFSKKPKQVVDAPVERMSPKELATMNGEPWVSISKLDIDIDTLSAGSVELDWNEIFVARLIKKGYRGKTDADIVDMWFQELCRGIAMELWEQQEAQDAPERRATTQRR
jgi:hypothetical protein